MDINIYHLNLDYLILAHELIQSGQAQKAMVSLGVTQEAASILANMPVTQLKELARSDVLCFAPRFSACAWGKFLRNESLANDLNEREALKLRLVLGKSSIQP